MRPSFSTSGLHLDLFPRVVTMQLFTLALLGACLRLGAAAPAPSGHTLHERRSVEYSPWTKAERLHAETILPMRIGLTQSNLDIGHDLLMDV